MKPPCDCYACREVPGGVPNEHDGHLYRLETDDPGGDPRWRWQCSCRRVGRWTYQSDNAAYHAWRRHVGLRVMP